jgi:hypothetical protein
LNTLKFCLNELNNFVLVFFFGEPEVKAEYAVVVNLGGTIPQNLFLPIEEISYNVFSKLENSKEIKAKEKYK